MVECPSCKKDIMKPKKSWAYGIFKVDAYSCECGANFREYANIHIILAPTSGNTLRLEKHSFKLILKKGRWIKDADASKKSLNLNKENS